MTKKDLNRIEYAAIIFAALGALTSCVFVYNYVHSELKDYVQYSKEIASLATLLYLYLIEYIGTALTPSVFRTLSWINKPTVLPNTKRARGQWFLKVQNMRILFASILLLIFVFARAGISIYTTWVGADKAADSVVAIPPKPKQQQDNSTVRTMQQQYNNNAKQIKALRADKIMYKGKYITKYVSSQTAAKLERQNAKLATRIADAKERAEKISRKDYERDLATWQKQVSKAESQEAKYSNAFIYAGGLSTILALLLYLALAILENDAKYRSRERGYSRLLRSIANLKAPSISMPKMPKKEPSRATVSRPKPRPETTIHAKKHKEQQTTTTATTDNNNEQQAKQQANNAKKGQSARGGEKIDAASLLEQMDNKNFQQGEARRFKTRTWDSVRNGINTYKHRARKATTKAQRDKYLKELKKQCKYGAAKHNRSDYAKKTIEEINKEFNTNIKL